MRRLLLALVLLVPAACTRNGETTVTVLAASSLTESFTAVAAAFEDEHPDVDVATSFGSSARLVAQVEAGAPADVVLTADATTAARLGAVRRRVVFARNRMAVAVGTGNPRSIRGLADLARPGLRVVLAAPEVPAGRYAAEVLGKAGVTVSPVSLEPDVKAAAAKVASGEADAAVVYATDIRSGLAEVPIPAEHNVEASYVAAVLRPAGEPLVDFLLSASGRRILGDAGFLAP